MANTKAVSKSKTEKHKRLLAYNDVITKNKVKFKAGSKLTRAAFVNLFGIPGIVHKGSYQKVHRANLALVRAQTEINALMAENGLYVSSRDYYNEFYVRDKNYTKSTIERFSTEVDVFDACTTRLEVKMTSRVNAGTWGRYNKLSAPVIGSIVARKPGSERHKQLIERIKLI